MISFLKSNDEPNTSMIISWLYLHGDRYLEKKVNSEDIEQLKLLFRDIKFNYTNNEITFECNCNISRLYTEKIRQNSQSTQNVPSKPNELSIQEQINQYIEFFKNNW